MGKLKKIWVTLIIIVSVLLLLFLFAILFFDLPFIPKCGSFGTGTGIVEQKCNCFGISYTPLYIGGGPIRCLGFCSKNKCTCKIRDVFLKENIQFECNNVSQKDPQLWRLCAEYDYYKEDCGQCKTNNSLDCSEISGTCQYGKNLCA